ncbi:MAG: PD40 domain-containing protein [Crocinitomicaceae bacterium]|nr:PD40 domain-containing protein [Crocinitomicaceae bacterium]
MKITSLALLLMSFTSFGQVTTESNTTSEWHRYSAISPDGKSIAFVHKGDIYIVSNAGGEPKRITTHTANDYHPVWNSDGSQLAFASNRYGNDDIFLINPNGGEATRLTFHSGAEVPYAFSSDDKSIIFEGLRMDDINHRQMDYTWITEVYTVPIIGGRVSQLWTITAQDINLNADGTKYLYHDRTGGENPWRKHHTSSVTRDIWMYDSKSDSHKKITSYEGEDRNPIFTKSETEFYYLSEASGTFNIHKRGIDPTAKSTQITAFKNHPIRFLSSSTEGILCFTHHGAIYTLTGESTLKKIDISINAESGSNEYEFLSLKGGASEMAVAPNGKEIVYVFHGEIFVSSVKGGMTKQITSTVEQEAFVSFSPDGKKIIYASERDGKWDIYHTTITRNDETFFFASTLLKEEKIFSSKKEIYHPEYSPDGKEIAYIEDKTTLRIHNLKSGKHRTLLTSKDLVYFGDGGQEFRWSPDSKWLAVGYSPTLANNEIMLIDASGEGKRINLTESGHGDYSAQWVDKGNRLIWATTRDGKRGYANSSSKFTDVYCMYMNKEAWEKSKLSKDELALIKEIEEASKKEKDKEKEGDKDKDKKDDEKKKDEEVKDVKIDFDGLTDRIGRLTIHSSDMSDMTLSKDGEKLYYISKFESKYNVWVTDLRTKETKILAPIGANYAGFQWDKKMENLFILSNGKPMSIDLKTGKTKAISISGTMKLNAIAERKQMFEHVWKRTKLMFYTPDFHGVDWEYYGDAYRTKVESIGNDAEFSELLSEMLGELNVSHAGAAYRGTKAVDETASLGIYRDYSYSKDGIKITEVLENDPLDKVSFGIEPGTIIKKIDGITVGTDIDDAQLLNKKMGNYTALEIYNPTTKETKTISVKPISQRQESSLIYERWVKQNAAEVAKASNGKLGYVHVPGMGDGPYRNLYGKIMGKFHECDGIVVDTRFNRGGDLVADLNMFLSGEQFITYETEERQVGYEPTFRWTKENVVLANEANYSDGSCFACGYQQQGIGKLIGMPVPGTCSFASWEGLQNGTIYWGAVAISAKNINGEWMENNQDEPDIKVKNDPNKITLGKDQQLETAIEFLLDLTK